MQVSKWVSDDIVCKDSKASIISSAPYRNGNNTLLYGIIYNQGEYEKIAI